MITMLTVLLLQASSPKNPAQPKAAPQGDGWTDISDKKGIKLEERPVKGTPLFEFRAQTDTDRDVDTLCRGVFEWGTLSKDHDNITLRKVIEDHPDTRVVYDQLTPPVVAPRDFAFTVNRTRKGTSCRIDMHVTNDKAPALTKGFVRIEQLRSSWQFDATDSGSHVTYMLFSNPGGDVPTNMVRNAQRVAAETTLASGIQAATKPLAEGKAEAKAEAKASAQADAKN